MLGLITWNAAIDEWNSKKERRSISAFGKAGDGSCVEKKVSSKHAPYISKKSEAAKLQDSGKKVGLWTRVCCGAGCGVGCSALHFLSSSSSSSIFHH